MKIIKLFSLVGLSLLFMLASCTMDKRVYTSGYHVEWKKDRQESARHEAVNNYTTSSLEKVEVNLPEKSTEMSDRVDSSVTTSGSNNTSTQKAQHNSSNKISVVSSISKDQTDQNTKVMVGQAKGNARRHGDGPKMNPFALIGFILFMLSLLPIVVSILFWPVGLIFSIIGLVQINRNPDRWRGKGLAKAVIIIAIIELLLALLIIALIVSLGGFSFSMG